jgi:iron complex outermembrane receptor protein
MKASNWLLMSGLCLLPIRVVQANGVSESLFLSDQPIVLTASRIQESPLDTPAPVTVIDREMIRDSGFTEIQNLMRLVPGFQVAEWYGGAPYHSPAIVANHGMGSAFPRTLLVMLDGQSIVDPIKGVVDWEDLPIRIQDIERIEVVRGPNQASYGAGAYNGVINIITRQPGEDGGGVVSLSAGKHGFRDDYARIGHRGESTDWRISASDRYLDSFEQTPESPYMSKGSRQTLMANAVHRLEFGDEVSANLDLSWGRNDLGSRSDPTDPYHDYSIQTQLLQLAWHASDALGTETFARYTHYGHQQNEAITFGQPYPPIYTAYDADTSQDGLEFQQTRTYSDTVKGVWGASVQYDQADAPHYFYNKGVVADTTWQAFGNLDWRFAPDWLLHVGGMLEKHGNTGTLFSPRLALNYSITPRHSIRASLGQGYRAPTLLESNSNEVFLSSGEPFQTGYLSALPLQPEKVKFSEIGYVGRFDEIGLQLDGRVYAEHYSNYISPYACYYVSCAGLTGIYTVFSAGTPQIFRNGGNIDVHGEEISADWRHPVLGRFLFSYAITRIHANGFADGDGFQALQSDMVLSAPLHSASLLWSKSLPWGLTGSVGYYHVGSMKWLDDGDFQPAYERIDLRLAKRLGGQNSKTEIALTLQGVNGDHAEFIQKSAETNVPVRQAFVTLKMGWD